MSNGTRRKRDRITGSALTVVLMVIALLGPVVAYAGVNVVWPSSTKTVNVNQNPPITFAQGQDYTLTEANNFAGAFSQTNADASYAITVSGLSGGTLTVDRLVNTSVLAGVQDFDVEISQALTVGGAGQFDLANVTTLKVRLWNGTVSPNTDVGAAPGVAGVRCVLDLKQPLANNTGDYGAGKCERPSEGYMHMQVLFALANGQSTEVSTVMVRPINVVLV